MKLREEIEKIVTEPSHLKANCKACRSTVDHVADLLAKEKMELAERIRGMMKTKCPNGGTHKWETHSTDSGAESYCSKCFMHQMAISQYNQALSDILERMEEKKEERCV